MAFLVGERRKQIYPWPTPSLNTGIYNSHSIDHFVVSVSPGRDKLSACTLQRPGMWTGINIIRFQSQNFSNLIVNLVNLNDLVLPSCSIYDTTVALAHIKRTTLPCR